MEAVLKQARQTLAQSRGTDPGPLSFEPVGGGCIHETGFLLDGRGGRRAFLKLHERPGWESLFEAEAAGLEALASAAGGMLRVPRPYGSGTAGGRSFLVMEALDLERPVRREVAEARLGEALACLHRSHGIRFGWERDNVIGETPQINTPSDDWVSFFREQRLRYQMDLAARNGLRLPKATRLLDRLDGFFEGYRPEPSLLHGDLWTGNIAFEPGGVPVVFDPAVYHGDREADIAFTEMFGGLGASFYRAYDRAYPLDRSYGVRRDLYNLYHVLNHFNLFGGGYGQQAERVVARLAEMGLGG